MSVVSGVSIVPSIEILRLLIGKIQIKVTATDYNDNDDLDAGPLPFCRVAL